MKDALPLLADGMIIDLNPILFFMAWDHGGITLPTRTAAAIVSAYFLLTTWKTMKRFCEERVLERRDCWDSGHYDP